MKRYKLSVLFDGAAVGLFTFITVFVIVFSFTNKTASLVCSAILGGTAFVLTAFLFTKRFDKKTLILNELPSKKNLAFHLCLYPSEKTFIKLYEFFGKNLIKTPKGLFLADENAYILPLFSFDGLKKSDIANAYKRANGKKTYILSDYIPAEIKEFCLPFGNKISFLSIDEIYLMFKKANMLPEEVFTSKKEKTGIKTVLNHIFIKKRTPKYLIFGITFFGFSFLTPYKAYYVIFGSVMMCVALACLLKKAPDKQKSFWED